MGKIIERHITNEDGDVYGVVGELTRLGAYRVIKEDLQEYGLENEFENFNQESLEECNFWQTDDKGGEHEDWIWWEKPKAELKPKPLGKGWIFRP